MPTINYEGSEFLLVDTDYLRDTRLTYAEKGLLTQLLAYSEQWQLKPAYLAASAPESEAAVRRLLKKLEEKGYIQRTQMRCNGRFLGQITEVNGSTFSYDGENYYLHRK